MFHTMAGVMALLLASPIYDGVRIYYSTKGQPEQANIDLRQARPAPLPKHHPPPCQASVLCLTGGRAAGACKAAGQGSWAGQSAD